MTLPFVDIIGGFANISGKLLELYKIKRDGSFFDQQEFLAEIREKEATLADERAKKLEILLHRLGDARAEAEDVQQADRELRNAHLAIASKRYLDSYDRQLGSRNEISCFLEETAEPLTSADVGLCTLVISLRLLGNSPFSYSNDEVYGIARQATNNGSRPALLIAPFYNDEDSGDVSDQGPPTFRVGIRRAWLNSPWASDLSPLDGLIDRPLRNTDLDIMHIQSTLNDLPVVLVYGEVQRSSRAWCSVLGWNLVPAQSAGAIEINLPRLPLPPLETSSAIGQASSARLDFEDALGDAVAQTAGVLGQWFHLTKYGRKPKMHRLLDPPNKALTSIGASLAAAYEVAIDLGVIDELDGRVAQLELLSNCGLSRYSSRLAHHVLELYERQSLRGSSAERHHLHCLLTHFEASPDVDGKARTIDLLESASRNYLLNFLNLGNS